MTPIKTGNEFFDPEAYDCEVLGFFEELVMQTVPGETSFGWKMLGCRRLPGLPDRPIGSAGTKMITIIETMTLENGHKTVIVRASKKKPLTCQATIQPICGKFKNPTPNAYEIRRSAPEKF